MGTCSAGQFCLPDQFGFKGGYCSEPCSTPGGTDCPMGSQCIQPGMSPMPLCFKSCATNMDCRQPDYECSGDGVCVPVGSASSGGDGTGVSPGTKGGEACVTPVVDPPGTGSLFEKDAAVTTGTVEANPSLAVDPATKHLVLTWTEVKSSVRSIGVSFSADGSTWGTATTLPPDKTVDKNAQNASASVAADPSGLFFATWLGYDLDANKNPTKTNVYVARIKSDGTVDKVIAALPVDEAGTAFTVDRPWVAVDDTGAVWLSWARLPSTPTGTIDIRVSRSADHGDTWSAPVTVSDSADRPGYSRDLAHPAALPGGGVVVAWVEIGSSPFGGIDNHVYSQIVAADGTKTGKNVEITGAGDSPGYEDPSVAVSGSNVYVTYSSGTTSGDWDVKIATSLDGGKTFAPGKKVNDDATCATHYHARAAIDGAGGVHVVYADNRYLVAGVFHQSSPAAAAGSPLVFGPATFVNSTAFPFSTNTTGNAWLGDYLAFTVAGTDMYAAWPDSHTKASHVSFAHGTAPLGRASFLQHGARPLRCCAPFTRLRRRPSLHLRTPNHEAFSPVAVHGAAARHQRLRARRAPPARRSARGCAAPPDARRRAEVRARCARGLSGCEDRIAVLRVRRAERCVPSVERRGGRGRT
jgi:hypothetical protein